MTSSPRSSFDMHLEKRDGTQDDISLRPPSQHDGESSTGSQKSKLTPRSILALVASALAYFCTIGFANAYGVFQQYYTAHYLQGTSNFKISWLGSFATFCLFAFAAPAGFLTDRYGPVLPICIGIAIELVAIFMISLCREYYQFFLAQGLALGIGMSMICIPTSTVVPVYFTRNRGLAQGVSIAGSSLGGILWPVALDQLLNHDSIEFGWSMRIIGFVMIPLLAATLLCLRQTVRGTKKADLESKETELKPVEKKQRSLAVLRNPSFILLSAGLAIANFGFFIPLFYIPTYAVHIHLSENLAFYLLSVFNGASLFGRILPGYVADHVGHFNILTTACFFSGILAFAWTTATTVAGVVIWTAAFGFISGAILSQQLACVTELSDEQSRGAAIGMALGSVSLTGLFGPPIAGALEKESGYLGLSCFSGAMLLAGAVLMAGARWKREKGLWAKV